MGFNQYQWNLYLQSKGKGTIQHFLDFLTGKYEGYAEFIRDLVAAFCPDLGLVEKIQQDTEEVIKALLQDRQETDPDELQKMDIEIKDGVTQPLDTLYAYEDENSFSALSVWKQWESEAAGARDRLYAFYEFADSLSLRTQFFAYEFAGGYFPYFFGQMFNVLQDIAVFFGIELPPIPGKRQLDERAAYYDKLCQCFYSFAIENQLSPVELWAFLYDYAPACVGGKEWVQGEIPEARNVFVFGVGTIYPEKDPDRIWIWQGSPDMQVGDIGLLYHWKPDKCYTSIWRAVSPGYYDPLASHDRQVCYGRPIEIPHITYSELKQDPVFSQTSLVKASMLRMDGAPMLPSEYMHLLDMAKAKGSLPDNVPVFERRDTAENGTLLVERDVEEQLLEPLLKRLGWESENWCRQMSVRIGRGTSKYPDYVINPIYTKNHEHGDIVLEAKLTIPNQKQLEIDRGQAHSYAKLLGSKAYVLVSKEGIWISVLDDDFTSIKGYTWNELEDADTFSAVHKVIGNRSIKTSRRKQ